MRPTIRLLTDELIQQILTEARTLLATLGVEIHNREVLSLLADHGGRVEMDTWHAFLPAALIDKTLQSAPSSFELYDVLGRKTHEFSGNNVYFTPGSAGPTS